MRVNQVDYEAGQPVDGYGVGYFLIGEERHMGPLAIAKNGLIAWTGWDDIDALKQLCDGVDIVFFGTGDDIAPLPAPVRDFLDGIEMGYEMMATPSACRTYNVILAEGRRVALAAIPVQKM